MADRFAERAARVLVITIRPEKRQQALATVVSAWDSHRQIGENGLPLGLRQDGVQDPSIGVEKIEAPKYLEFNHLAEF